MGEMADFDSCVSWSFENEYKNDYDTEESNLVSSYECCLYTLPTTVKNCGEFRVYHIGPTQACSIAYCSAPPESNSRNSTFSWPYKTLEENKTSVENEV